MILDLAHWLAFYSIFFNCLQYVTKEINCATCILNLQMMYVLKLIVITHNKSWWFLQESIILKEAVWCKYVIILFVLFLIFKLPYIVVDIMTQLNFPLVFEPEASGDGARFYFQIALSWMTFCYSALFPIVTFFQFPDHWRKMKSYVTCAPTTTSAANGKWFILKFNLSSFTFVLWN